MSTLILALGIAIIFGLVEVYFNSRLIAERDRLYLRALKAESRLEYLRPLGKVDNKINRKV